MIDPVTLGLISLAITSFIQLVITIHASVKNRQFHSECMGCEVDYSSEHQTQEKK